MTESTPSLETIGKDPQKVKEIFENVALNYDKANDVLSLGIHHLWRKKLVDWTSVVAGERVLDCATGTGDLAIEFKRAVGPSGQVIGTDFCAEMMLSAPAKAQKQKLQIEFQVADVMKLPYADASFDIASISFGIRNVADPKRAIAELQRVLRPGGRLMILEFGQPKNSFFGSLYKWYSRHVLPKIGGVITGHADAYAYLEESSAEFPCREDFVKIMQSSASFRKVEYRTLTGGIAYIYKAVK